MRGMVRGRLTAMIEGAIKLFSATGRSGERFSGRECFQHYGFSSAPLAGAEVIVIGEGNHIVIVAEDDRRYRVGVEGGEVAIYSHEGDKIHLKQGRVVEIETETLLIKAGQRVRIESPVVEATGDIVDLVDSSGRSMDSMRSVYNSHVHPENDSGGPTSSPNQEM